MPPDLALSSTLIDSNHPCLKLVFMVPNVFEPLKLDCIYKISVFTTIFLFPPKSLDPCQKKDLEFLDCFGRKKKRFTAEFLAD